MRYRLAVVALLILAGLPILTPSAGVQPAVVSAAANTTTPADDTVTVAGTVEYENGTPADEAVVLVGDCALFEKSSPDRLRKIASDDPQDVRVIEVASDGSYDFELERDAAPCVVGVSSTAISDVFHVEAGGGHVPLTLHAAKPLRVEVTTAVTEPGGRDVVTISVKNTADEPIRNLRVKVSSLPQGWNVVATRSEGATYHPGNRTFVWDRVAVDAWAEADMRLFVSVDAETKTYEFPVFADSDTHPVTAENLTVKVRYPTTHPSVTETAVPVGEDGNDTGISAPGFGAIAALAALLAVGLLARR